MNGLAFISVAFVLGLLVEQVDPVSSRWARAFVLYGLGYAMGRWGVYW